MKKSIYLITIVISLNLFAKENELQSIMGVSAKTLKQGQVGFGTFPGGNGSTPMSTNALNVGLTDNFEIGTIPGIYLLNRDGNDYTAFTAKVKTLETQQFEVAIGKTQIDVVEKNFGIPMSLEFTSVNFNYLPQGRSYNVGLSLNYAKLQVEVFGINKDRLEYILESNFYLKRKYWGTVTLGESTPESFTLKSDNSFVKDYFVGTGFIRKGKLKTWLWDIETPIIGMSHFINTNHNTFTLAWNF